MGAGHARDTLPQVPDIPMWERAMPAIDLPANQSARSVPRLRAGVPTLAHAHAQNDQNNRSARGNSSRIFRKTGKKSGMVLFFCMISMCWPSPPRAMQRPRRIGRSPRPLPNLPKEREIFSSADQPGPTGVPDFGKTENRKQGRWRARAGGVVVGAGLLGVGRVMEHVEKRSF